MNDFNAESFVGNYLAHYVDPNYDPAKAHEYYLENRDLKGKKAAKSKVTDAEKAARKNQAAAKKATNQQLAEKKKAESTALSDAQRVRLETLRTNAELVTSRIEEKLRKFLDALDKNSQVTYEPPKLLPIPENVGPQRKAALEKRNQSLLNEAHRKYADAQSKTDASKRKAGSDARSAAAEEKRRVGVELKSAVFAARKNYEDAKAQLAAKYKTPTPTS